MSATTMSVTVDDDVLQADTLGLSTVGDVIRHVSTDDRLVVQVLLDGTEPDLAEIDRLRSTRLDGRVLYIETARPRAMARDVLESVDLSLDEADAHRTAAAELFRNGDAAAAMQKLSGCFAVWTNAHDSLTKIARLLRADLSRLTTPDGRTVEAVVVAFGEQLRQLRDALEGRDYVLCCDVLTYDMDRTTEDFRAANAALRGLAG